MIRNFECAHLSESQIGGKAFHLVRLERHGASVPPWAVIPAGMKPNPDQISVWMNELKQQGFSRFIVRSSMVGEDSANCSFAGQLVSVPNLENIEDILTATQTCIQSALSERVTAYRNRLDNTANSPNAPRVAVILQAMIEADRAGVLFTADPKDGNRLQFLISATFGGCESVVSGEVDCDEYEINPLTFQTKSRIAHKTHALYSGEKGRFTARPVPQEKQNVSSLTEEDLRHLVLMGRNLTTHEARPLDIEWVIQGSQLWIVQMRPIASLGHDTSNQNAFVFDNSNIQESYNGLTLPLTFAFASEAYHSVYSQVMELVGFSAQEIARHDRRHSQMLALIHGRVYYNINNWYEGLLLLPSFKRNKKDMEDMMGVEEPVHFVVDQNFSRSEKLKRVPVAINLIVRLGWAFSRIDSHVLEFRRQFQNTYSGFQRQNLPWMSTHQLIEQYRDISKKVLSNWKAPILNDFFVMQTSGQCRRALKAIGKEHLLPDLLAAEKLESTEPTKHLVALACQIKANPDLLTQLQGTSDLEFLHLIEADAKIKKTIDSYIETYGDRVVGELKLETETLRYNKDFLVRILRGYVNDSKIDLDALIRRQKAVCHKAETEATLTMSEKVGRRSTRKFLKNLRKFRKAVVYREAMRLDRTRSFGMFRSIAKSIGQKFFEQNLIDRTEDIFYVTFQEIDDFCHGKALFSSLRSVVDFRKIQYQQWTDPTPPSHIRTSLPMTKLPARQEVVFSCDLSGLGCYPGIVEAEVVVVEDVAQSPSLEGKILVAERTDPGWTPLFLQVSGLIVEKGSQLSHSAVVARELGIPTVVSVPGVCRILKTGDRVRLDGSKGTIHILNTVIKIPTPETTASGPIKEITGGI